MRTLAASSLTLLLVAPLAHAAISGSIVDPGGNPLAGVTVRAFAVETRPDLLRRMVSGKIDPEPLASATTSDTGEFRLEKIAQPTVDLVATAAGRETVTRFTADREDVALMMREAKPRRFRVVANGKPVANAIVEYARSLFVRTGTDGTFEVPTPPQGARGVVIYHPDYAPADASLPRTGTDIRLDAGAVVKGKVLAADGKPAADAALSIAEWPMGKSGADGSFTIAHAPSAWRDLRAVSGSDIAIVTRGDSASYTLRLRRGVTVAGVVRDAKTRVPVAGMIIGLRGEGAITDSAGAFTFSPILPGRYGMSATHPLYQIESGVGPGLGLVVREGGSKESLAATPLPLISGTVLDEERKPVAGAFVGRAGRPAELPSTSTVTKRNGAFAFHALTRTFDTDFDVTKDGYAAASFPVTPGEGKTGVNVTLKRGVPFAIHVIDTQKNPVAGVLVHVSPSREGGFPPSREILCSGGDCSTGGDGSLTLRVAPAKYDIRVAGGDIVQKRLSGENVDARSGTLTITVERGADVSGRVTYTDGKPIPSPVRVSMNVNGTMISELTDDAGAFVLHGVPRGRVTLRPEIFEATRFAGPPKEVTAPAANVILTIPHGGRISGRVIDASSGAPVTDFEVSTARNAGFPGLPATTPVHAEDGTFTIQNVMPGRVEVIATAEGYVRGSASGIDVAESQAVENVELRLDRAGRVKGHVTSNDGQALSGVTVAVVEAVRRGPGPSNDRATTDADGDYELNSVPPGQRNLTFNKDGFVAAMKSVEAAAGKDARLDATLERGRELSGRVIDESGQAVAGADIRAEGEPVRPVETDSEGSFRLAGLRDGKFRIIAHKNGYVDDRQEVDTVAQPNVTLTLGRGATITGRIVGLTADELSNAIVSFYGMGFGNARPDSAGNFTITGVRDGRITVQASSGSMSGNRSARKTIDVINGSAPPVELVFTTGYTVHGRVNAHGRSMADFNINFSAGDSSLAPGSGRLDNDGNYSVSGLGAGEYHVSIFGPMVGLVYNEKYTVSGDGIFDVDLRTSSLRGRVTDRDGKPISDARVVAEVVKRVAMSPPPRPAVTDSDGRYVVDFIGDGAWRLVAQKEQYQPATREVTVAGGAPDVDFQLTPASMTSVRVVDATTGAPVFATVSAIENGHSVFSTQTRAGDGVAELWLGPGHYAVTIGAQHYARTTSSVDVPGPEVRVTLTHGATIDVVSKTNAPVRLLGGGGIVMMNGTTHFENVPAGAYTVQLLGSDGKVAQTKQLQVLEGMSLTVTFD
jgi:uncharacterized GH25 family protein